MGFHPHPSDETRGALALRALWIGLVLFGLSLWAVAAAPSLPHRKAFDTSSYEQIVKLDPASSERAFKAKLDKATPRQDSVPGHEPALAFAGLYSVGSQTFTEHRVWPPSGPIALFEAEAHHYSATGPPGRQLS
jgi:hypothetical protein